MTTTLRIVLAALLVLCQASAHAAWDCLPSVPVRSAATPAGDAWAWWCQIAPAADGTPLWRRNTFVVLAKHRDPVRYFQASLRVVAAADPVAQANAEITAAMVTPPAGSVDEYEVQRLAWLACGEAIKEPWPAAFAPAPTCGAAPVPPANPTPPAPTAYVVSVAQAFGLKPDGTRSTTRWPASPALGEPCDCAVQVLQFGARFCRVPSLSTPAQTVVAACVAKK
jgi:hypothetical protein